MTEPDSSIQAQHDRFELYEDYAALRDRAGLVSLHDAGVFTVTGRDRREWLHSLTTIDFHALSEGYGAYGLILNGTAHVLADFFVLTLPDAFVLYTGRNAADKLYTRLRRSIFRERVAIARNDERTVLSLQGPRSRHILDETLDCLPSLDRFQHVATRELICVRNPRARRDGYDLLVPRDQVPAIMHALTQHGARRVSLAALNVARIEAGMPWFGEDFDETMLAPEARLDTFIAENKGCYPGQEVIARIRNRGHVNRLLVQLQCDGDVVPLRGDLVFSGDGQIGWITSPTWSFDLNRPLALGYVRREWSRIGTHVHIAHDSTGIQAEVTGL